MDACADLNVRSAGVIGKSVSHGFRRVNVSAWVTRGLDVAPLDWIYDLVIDMRIGNAEDGILNILNPQRSRVTVFIPDGELVREMGGEGGTWTISGNRQSGSITLSYSGGSTLTVQYRVGSQEEQTMYFNDRLYAYAGEAVCR